MISVETADFILLPFEYEVIYDFSDAELAKFRISAGIIPFLQELAGRLNARSLNFGKPLLVFLPPSGIALTI